VCLPAKPRGRIEPLFDDDLPIGHPWVCLCRLDLEVIVFEAKGEVRPNDPLLGLCEELQEIDIIRQGAAGIPGLPWLHAEALIRALAG
jgi:hypothetical protein